MIREVGHCGIFSFINRPTIIYHFPENVQNIAIICKEFPGTINTETSYNLVILAKEEIIMNFKCNKMHLYVMYIVYRQCRSISTVYASMYFSK